MNTFRARPSGDAFILFASPEQREKAMERDRQQMGSRYIEVCALSTFVLLFGCALSSLDAIILSV